MIKVPFKFEAPGTENIRMNTGLVDEFVGTRIVYQSTMHTAWNKKPVAQAFSKLQQDLTRAAKFKTNIEVGDLIYLYYFKRDVLIDLCQFKRLCLAANTYKQAGKTGNNDHLALFVKGANPLFYQYSLSYVKNNYPALMMRWNDIKRMVDTLLPLPYIPDLNRTAYFASNVFKDYESDYRSPLFVFDRAYTNNFSINSAKDVTVSQSTATTAGADPLLDVLDSIQSKIETYLTGDGNYICGLLRKLEVNDVFKADSSFWTEWKEGDTINFVPASDIKDILQNVWITAGRPAAFTDEQVLSTYTEATGAVKLMRDKADSAARSNILAGKVWDEENSRGNNLCCALQFVNSLLTTDHQEFVDSCGMLVLNVVIYMYNGNESLYHLDALPTNQDQNLQWVNGKYHHQINYDYKVGTANAVRIVNPQGNWRFEFTQEDIDTITCKFIESMFTMNIKSPSKAFGDKKASGKGKKPSDSQNG